MRVAFLCLGVMGGPMAGHLARAGHEVTVYNRNPKKREAWLRERSAHRVRAAASPLEAARDAEFVLCGGACVPGPQLQRKDVGPCSRPPDPSRIRMPWPKPRLNNS